MKTKEMLGTFSNARWLRFFFIALITLGIIFRFTNLDQKIYWADEAFTSLRISGYTLKEVAKEVYTTQVISIKEFQKYQRIDSSKGVSDTVQGLATEEPQLTPFYFIAARFWSQWFGNSVAAIRSFSAVTGSLAVLAMFSLCLELFNSRLSAWVGAAIVAVSPFYVLYSQEARPYSLLTLVILLSSSLLLRSIRQPTYLNWGLYSLTVVLGLYSHLFFALAAIGHGAYILLQEKFRVGKTLMFYLLALVLGILTFVPWLMAIAANRHQAQIMTSWSDEKLPLFHLVGVWAGNISRLFLDFGLSSSLTPSYIVLAFLFPVLLIVLLAIYSIYFIHHHTHPKIWLFIFSLIGVTILLIWLPDIVSGERQSTAPRYSISLFLGIQLSVVYLLSVKLTEHVSEGTDANNRLPTSMISQLNLKSGQRAVHTQRNLWLFLMISLFSCSIFSCALSVPAKIWWSKSPQYTRHIPYVANLINQMPLSRLVTISTNDGDLMRVESLAYLLKPDVELQFFNLEDGLSELDVDRSTFVYLPGDNSQKVIDQAQRKLKQVINRKLIPLANTDDRLFKISA